MSEKIEERIKELEERMASTVPNKHTQRSINFIRAQLAKCRDELVKIASSKKGGGTGFGVKKAGDAQVAFIGFPSVGKSTLLNLLTDGATHSKVAAYEFTTLQAVPGMMDIEQAKIQLIDLPGIILGAAVGKGRGKEVLGAARNAQLVLIILSFQPDGSINYEHAKIIRKELWDAGIRLNQEPAHILVEQRGSGSINFTYQGKQNMDKEEVKSLMQDLGFQHAVVVFYQSYVTPDQLIDHVLGNRVYMRELVVINKSDLANPNITDDMITKAVGHDHWIKISAINNENIQELKKRIFKELSLIRVFLRPPGGGEPDMQKPMILKEGDTIEQLASKLHKSFVDNFRYASVWGKSVKHPGQKFDKMDHVLMDGDIVSLYLKRSMLNA